MSSTECPTDATDVDSEDKTTVENAEKQESEENAEKQESEGKGLQILELTENASWAVSNERGLAPPGTVWLEGVTGRQ